MREVDSPYPPGEIVLAAPMQPRFWEFSVALDQLLVPRGTKFALCRSCDVSGNFNRGVAQMTPDKQWAWFLGDDHVFQPDFLLHLLSRQVPVVVPINIVKILPFRPLIYHGPYAEHLRLYTWAELSEPGLVALPDGDFTGQAGMLVQRPVLDRLGYPWFKPGQLDPGKLQEDMTFCRDLQALGETIWIDRDVVLDHIFFVTMSARRNRDGEYEPLMKSGKHQLQLINLETPQPYPTVVPTNGHRPALQWAEAEVEA